MIVSVLNDSLDRALDYLHEVQMLLSTELKPETVNLADSILTRAVNLINYVANDSRIAILDVGQEEEDLQLLLSLEDGEDDESFITHPLNDSVDHYD